MMSLHHSTQTRKRKYDDEENEIIPLNMASTARANQPSQQDGQFRQDYHQMTCRQPEQQTHRNLIQQRLSRPPIVHVPDTSSSFSYSEAYILPEWRREWDTEPHDLVSSRPLALLTDRAPINLTTHEQTAKSTSLDHCDYQHEPPGRMRQRLRAEEEERQQLNQHQNKMLGELSWQEEREYERMRVKRRAKEVGAIDLTKEDDE